MDTVKTYGRHGWGLLLKVDVFNKNGNTGQYKNHGLVYDVIKDGDMWFHTDDSRR